MYYDVVDRVNEKRKICTVQDKKKLKVLASAYRIRSTLSNLQNQNKLIK